MVMVTIYCVDCWNAREIKPQDVFQVKRCVPCQKKYATEQRRMKAQWKREDAKWAKEQAAAKAAKKAEHEALMAKWAADQLAEEIAEIEAIGTKFRTTGKMSWEEYCRLKHNQSDICERDMIKWYGYGECQSNCSEFDDSEIEYFKSWGLTDQDIEDKRADRGAANLIDNEMDQLGDINRGKEDRYVEYLVEDAIKRINNK